MQKTDHSPFDPWFEWRLKAALDRVTPPSSPPRYAAATAIRLRPWRLAPAVFAAAAVLLFALTVTAATGSPNPAVWTQRAATSIQSVEHATSVPPVSQPSPEQAQPAPRSGPAPVAASKSPAASPQHRSWQGRDPSEGPDESPQPSGSAGSWWGNHNSGGTGSPSPRPSPSPWPSHWPSPSPWPSPWPSPSPGSADH